MRAFRPSSYGESDPSDSCAVLEDRARFLRVERYAGRAEALLPLFEAADEADDWAEQDDTWLDASLGDEIDYDGPA